MLRRLAGVGVAAVLAVAVAPPAGAGAGPDPARLDPARLDPARLDPADPYFPTLGNAGFDVEHYDIGVEYTPDSDRLDGDTTIRAIATRRLPRFALDLVGFRIARLRVGGRDARFRRTKTDVIVRPAAPIAKGARFEVRVQYAGIPRHGRTPGVGAQLGWVATDDGAITFNEPDGARYWFPGNDHPSDKATFAFRVDVPTPLIAVANGTLASKQARGSRTVWRWNETAPMTTYLTQIAIGELELRDEPPVDGVAIRNAFAPDVAERATDATSDTAAMLRFFATRFSAYPFSAYGVMVPAGAPENLAFEAQTFSLVAPDFFEDPVLASAVLAHELAHQWFGDAVSPGSWQDTWLNEGFATYAEWLWSDHALDDPIEDAAAQAIALVEQAPGVAADDPGRDEMFGVAPYERGALTLYALSREVGDATFTEIVRTYVGRFSGRTATTDDFVAIASEVAGRDLSGFLRDWLGPGPLPDFPCPAC